MLSPSLHLIKLRFSNSCMYQFLAWVNIMILTFAYIFSILISFNLNLYLYFLPDQMLIFALISPYTRQFLPMSLNTTNKDLRSVTLYNALSVVQLSRSFPVVLFHDQYSRGIRSAGISSLCCSSVHFIISMVIGDSVPTKTTTMMAATQVTAADQIKTIPP